jgi:hypothetical protein
MRARDRDGISPLYTYLLRRRGAKWFIVYDTFLEAALRGAISQVVQASIDPDAKRASARAVAAGNQAASDFRRAGLGG